MWLSIQAQWAKPRDVLPGGEGFALILQVHVIDAEVTFLLHDGERMNLLLEDRIEVYRSREALDESVDA